MNSITKTCFFFAILWMIGCDADESNLLTPSTPSTETVDPNTTTREEDFATGDSDYIFDQSRLHTFELTLPAADLARIDADPSAEEYVEGDLTFEGETLGSVGIRYKGSIGAYVGCLSGTNWANPSGRKTCSKLSMKIKTNWNGSEDTFYGLKKLQFHSLNNDDSQLRDRLGYWLFREMGVPAPRSVHARLVINGVYSGLYALVEQIDGRFTRDNFDDGKGNLYKEVWPLSSNGQPFPDKEYLDHLKTNENENPTVEMIRTFAQEIEQTDDANLQTVISKWMNIEEIISYAVVDRTIRNDDGAFHWYCQGSDCSPHNFYWYEEPTARTMHLIPWDLDNAFENIINDANPVTPIVDAWGMTSANCEPFSHGFLGIKQRSAACDKLIGAWASFEEMYLQRKQELLEGPLSEAIVNQKLDEWEAQITEATKEAQNTNNDAITLPRWRVAIQNLKTQLSVARKE